MTGYTPRWLRQHRRMRNGYRAYPQKWLTAPSGTSFGTFEVEHRTRSYGLSPWTPSSEFTS